MPGSSIITDIFQRHRRAAFSLVEMLVVMVIIVIMVLATLPAIRGLNQAESRRGAVDNLMATLDHARMMAISDGLSTYVVFASKPISGIQQINPNLWGQAYAIFEDGDNISFLPVQKTPWMLLPQGIAFKAPGNGILSVMDRPTNSKDPAFAATGSAAPNGPGTSVSVNLPYWKFDTTGVIDESTLPSPDSSYLRLLLFPGFINAQGIEISTQNGNGAGNSQPLQLEEIDVIPTTGRARYIIDPNNNLSPPSSTPSP